jgi:hypothetical protein
MRSVPARSILGREILRMTDCPVNGKDVWSTRYNNELCALCVELDTVKLIKKQED